MPSPNPMITCSNMEACFLAGLLGASWLLGIDDPFQGWLMEEIQSAWLQTKTALQERNYIASRADGQVVVDTTVAGLIRTWAFPDTSLIVTLTPPVGAEEVHYFHLGQALCLEQTPAGAAWQLQALADVQGVYARVLELLAIQNQVAAPGASARFPQSVLTEAQAVVARTASLAVIVLRQAGLPGATADSLADALAQPIHNSSLVGLARRLTAWEVGGLGLLEGPNGLWRLRSFTRGSEAWVEATPCSGAQAREEVRRALNRVLIEPLITNH